MTHPSEKVPSGDTNKAERKIVGITPEIDEILQRGISPLKIQEESEKNKHAQVAPEILTALMQERDIFESPHNSLIPFKELLQYAIDPSLFTEARTQDIEYVLLHDSSTRDEFARLKEKLNKPDLPIVKDDKGIENN